MTISLEIIITAAIAALLGLMIGFSLRSGLKRRAAVLAERVDGLIRERDTAYAERDRLATEVKAREAQIRPLSDEVDKLRRDFARSRLANPGDGTVPAGAATVAADPNGVAVDPLDLARLKGIGPKFADRLRAAGITRIDQIAGWTTADAEVIDGQMGEFRGRIASDRLIEQARLLTEGRVTEYETVFGKLGG